MCMMANTTSLMRRMSPLIKTLQSYIIAYPFLKLAKYTTALHVCLTGAPAVYCDCGHAVSKDAAIEGAEIIK